MSSYRDYSTYLLNGGELIKHKKSDRNFPVKLHRIVSDPMNAHIITWLVRRRDSISAVARMASPNRPSLRLFSFEAPWTSF